MSEFDELIQEHCPNGVEYIRLGDIGQAWMSIRQPLAGDINWNEFISLGFTHHMEILSKTKDISERLFYIHECAVRAWDKYTQESILDQVCTINREIYRITFLIHLVRNRNKERFLRIWIMRLTQ